MTGPDDGRHHEVLTMGRVGVDIYPEQIGVPLEDVRSFGKFLGGSPTNVAVAAARHGRRSAVITRTGEDPFGRFVHQALRGFGVDDRFVTGVPDLPTPVTFCEIFPPTTSPSTSTDAPPRPTSRSAPRSSTSRRSRRPTSSGSPAPGSARSRRGRRPWLPSRRAVSTASPSSTSTTGPCSGRRATRPTPTSARRCALVDVAVGNKEECQVAVGETEPERAAAALLAAGVDLAVVKQGPEGVLGVRDGTSVVVPPVPVEVVNGLGAGDAFGGALCHGLLADWDVERMLRFANAAGSFVAGRLACADAMPTTAELEAVLEGAA